MQLCHAGIDIGSTTVKLVLLDETGSRIYEEYRRTGYDPLYLEEHAEEIQLHEQAKAAFDQLPDKKIPKVKELNEEYARIVAEKKKAYAEYRIARSKAKELQIALKNAEIILENEQEQKTSRKNRRNPSR